MAVKTSIYLDTSVINFLFADDAPAWQANTVVFFNNYIKTAVYQTFVSKFVVQEINNTRSEQKRRQLLSVIEDYSIPLVEFSDEPEISQLASLYILNKIIPASQPTDALHIAVTVVNKIDYLVSWNFQHLANANRERKVLAVNYANNHLHPLRIVTPLHLMDLEN